MRYIRAHPLCPVATIAVDSAITDNQRSAPLLFCSVLFCSLAVLDPRVGHTMDVLSPFISISCLILIDFSTGSPVHVLMLSIHAVRGLPRLRAPGSVPYYGRPM